MARKLRIQYPDALYHVINRGNYRRDVFETAGAAQAFEGALAEGCVLFNWRIHAHAVMRNHYHLALQTPEANLVEGMHWLQSTFATRFNRHRAQRGHLFQGRYQALLVEDGSALARVIHYINLNPVRAGIVEPAAVAAFRWGSLRRFFRGARPPWLTADVMMATMDLEDSSAGWRAYVEFLIELASNLDAQHQMGFADMCRGWAIGTSGWRRALAREYSALSLEKGFEREQLRELKESRWRDALNRALLARGHSIENLDARTQPLEWKLQIAAELRRQVDAPYRWMAQALNIEHASSLRMQVHRRALHVSA